MKLLAAHVCCEHDSESYIFMCNKTINLLIYDIYLFIYDIIDL